MSGERERDLQAQVEALAKERDEARAEIIKWHTQLSAVMPMDFKDWHQNSPAEWPMIAAMVINNLTKERDDRLRALLREAGEALRTHIGWIDSERTGPDYGPLTRDTHPRGEEIWGAWWQGQLDQCSLTEARTRAVLAKLEALK